MYVPRAMYSLRMSFWVVPADPVPRDALGLGGGDVERQQDRRRGVDRHRGADLAERQPVEQDRHVGKAADRHADPADLALRRRRVRVVAHLRRQVEGHRQPGLALLEQVAEAAVGLLGGGEARVLAHRPEAAPVHRRLDAAGERVFAGPARGRGPRRGRVDVGRRVEVTDLDARTRSRTARVAPAPPRAPSPGRVSRHRSRPGRSPPRRPAPGRSVSSAHSRTTSTSPSSTVEPAPTATRATVPARGRTSSFCIFIASTTRRRLAGLDARRRPRRRPTTILPGMMARISSGPLAAPSRSRSRVARSRGARPAQRPRPRARTASRRRRPRPGARRLGGRRADPGAGLARRRRGPAVGRVDVRLAARSAAGRPQSRRAPRHADAGRHAARAGVIAATGRRVSRRARPLCQAGPGVVFAQRRRTARVAARRDGRGCRDAPRRRARPERPLAARPSQWSATQSIDSVRPPGSAGRGRGRGGTAASSGSR